MKSKRIWAMMGVVYVIIIFCLTTYWIATTTLISGITGIMLFPAAAALSAQFFNRSWILKHGRLGHEEEPDFVEPESPLPGSGKCMAGGVLFGALAFFLLITGIQQTIHFLGGA